MTDAVKTATAFAPASIGNVGVGFDVLGLAISGAGDRVTAVQSGETGIRVSGVFDPNGNPHDILSSDPDRNTASIAARSLWDAVGAEGGLDISVHKGIPLQSGMGSSAASAVAAVVAANALLPEPLPVADLLIHALEGEAFASGGKHADNVAPSLLGGLVLCPTILYPDCQLIPVPSGVSSVLLHPELKVNTAESRRGLSPTIERQAWVDQQGLLASFVAACSAGETDRMAAALRDIVIEPQRAAAVSVFEPVKRAAIANGAMGCSLSGSGPSIFALAIDENVDMLAGSMRDACEAEGVDCQVWVSPMASPGASLEE